MIITYSLAVVAMIVCFLVFLSPAYAYHMVFVENGQEINNVSLLNIATGWSYTSPVVPFELDEIACTLLVTTITSIIAMTFCILFYQFWRSKTGLKIKRMIFATAVGFTFAILNLCIISALASQTALEGKTIGLAFIFYFLANIAALALLVGEIICIYFRFQEKYNWQRFQELILIEESLVPLIKDEYHHGLAEANLIYMKACHKAPYVSKEKLEQRRQEALQILMVAPHEHDENCTCGCHDHKTEKE